MSGPASGNLPPIDTHEFNRAVLPFTLFFSGQQDVARTLMGGGTQGDPLKAVRDVSMAVGDVSQAPSDITQTSTPEDRVLYGRLGAVFPANGGEYERLIRSGNFGPLLAYAGRAALELTADRELTVPGVFAIHALASVIADTARPPGVPHAEDRTTYFLTQLAGKLAWTLPLEAIESGPNPYDFMQAAHRRIERLGKAAGAGAVWLEMKLRILADRMLLRSRLTSLVDTEPTVEVDDISELRRTNDELFGELQRLKRYSIKSAVHTHGNVSWSIHDMADTHEQMVAARQEDHSNVRPENWQPRMLMMAVEQPVEDGDETYLVQPLLDASGRRRPNMEEYGRHAWMDEDGELFADMHGAVPLRQVYETAGKPGNYESLRQFLLQKHFDLTVPIEIVRSAEAETHRLLGGRNADEAREQGIVYRDLLLPRIRVLRSIRHASDLDALDARERQEAETRKKRYHHVVAHPVKLPEGYRPNPEAVAKAKELGIVLRPGETLRIGHWRGDPSLGGVVHHARPRRQTDSDSEES